MMHTAVVLPRDLLERLKTDAEKAGRGLSTEIRQRLQMSYDAEPDPRTSDLVECVKELARSLAHDMGWWYQTPGARKALQAGVSDLLKLHPAKGEDSARPDTPVGGRPNDDPPEVIGRTHARFILRARARET